MRKLVRVAVFTLAVASGAMAQHSGPVDLSKLPDEIKTLPWKGVDTGSMPAIDRCTALLVLNDVLDELNARLAAESDLMSEYIDVNSLGPAYVATPPAAGDAPLAFGDGLKIAAALLKGPLAGSAYPQQLAGSPADQLSAYETMYTSSCTRKWGTMIDHRLRVRSMGAFMTAQGRMNDYQAWAPGEAQRLAAQHQAAADTQRQQAAEKDAQKRQQAQQLQAERGAAQQKEEAQTQQATTQMQQAMTAAQAQNQPAQDNPALNVSDGAYPATYYEWGAGAYAAGAAYRDGAYTGAACARTDARLENWHRGGGRRR